MIQYNKSTPKLIRILKGEFYKHAMNHIIEEIFSEELIRVFYFCSSAVFLTCALLEIM